MEPFTLKNIYMRIESGEFVGLIGPNGGGKTSLLRCAMRYSKPESGLVGLAGNDLWAQPAPIELMLRTNVDLETGQIEIQDLGH